MSKFISFRVVIFSLVALVISGCGSSVPDGYDVYSDPALLEWQARSVEQEVTSQRDVISGDIYQAEVNAQATLNSIQAQAQATREAVDYMNSVATQESVRVTQEVISAQSTRDQIAYETSQAEMLAVLRSNSTGTAVARETASSIEATSTAFLMSVQATQTVQSIAAAEEMRDLEIEQKTLEVERDRMNNTLRAFFGYVLWGSFVGALIFVLVKVILRASKVKHYKRDPFSAPGYLIDVDSGKLIMPELAPGVVTDIKNPTKIDPSAEAYIKGMALRVEAVRANALSGGRDQGLLGSEMTTIPTVEVIDAGSVREVLDEVDQKLLESPE